MTERNIECAWAGPEDLAKCAVEAEPEPITVEYREIASVARTRVRVIARFTRLQVTKRKGWLGGDTWVLNVTCKRKGQTVAERQLFSGDVTDGTVRVLDVAFGFLARPGDNVRCSVNGTDRDHNLELGLAQTGVHAVSREPHDAEDFTAPGATEDVSYLVTGAWICKQR